MKKTYYVIDYQNGNRRIDEKDVIRAEERNFILTGRKLLGYTSAELDEIKAELTPEAFSEWLDRKIDENLAPYIVGSIEAEKKPDWDDLERDPETGEYHLKETDSEEIYVMTATEFAELNGIGIDDIQTYSDANVGAENLAPDTELEIIVRNGEIRVTRSDNPWNEPVDVVYGPAENWTYKK